MFLNIPAMLSCMIRGTGGRRVALGKHIKLLRDSQRLSMEAAAVKAQISAVTWRRVEKGQGVQTRTYRAVEEILGLPRGIIDDYLANKVPLEALERKPEPQRERDPLLDSGGLSAEQLEQVRALIRAMRGRDDRSA